MERTTGNGTAAPSAPLRQRAETQITVATTTGVRSSNPHNIYQIAQELLTASGPDSPLINLLRRARDQLSVTANFPPDADPLVVLHERGVSAGLADEINEYLKGEDLL